MNNKTHIFLGLLAMVGSNGTAFAWDALTPAPSRPVIATIAAAGTPGPAAANMNAWKGALASAYRESQAKEAEDGMKTFMATFFKDESQNPKNSALCFGKRDGFRKVTYFTESGMELMNVARVYPSLLAYIAVPDGQAPILFLMPMSVTNSGQLNMQKVAVMVDGNVILEHDFRRDEVERTRSAGGYTTETYQFVATADDIAALRKITPKSNVAVRLTGSKSYLGLKKHGAADMVKVFQTGTINTMHAFDALTKALAGHAVQSN